MSEDCLSSKSWLCQNGLKVQNLSLYDALADCAFRHADGAEVAMAKLPDVVSMRSLTDGMDPVGSGQVMASLLSY